MPLTFEEAVGRVPFLRQASRLSVAPLRGGVTNQNYRVDADGETFVVRIGTDGTEVLGIDRRREQRCMQLAGGLGIAPEVVYARPQQGILVTRFVRGRMLTSGRPLRPAVRTRFVRAMRRLHRSPAFPGTFLPFRTLETYRRAAEAGPARLPRDLDRLWEGVTRLAPALRRGLGISCPCHNDLWGPNLIDDGRRIWIVDWEYAAMGDVYFDLANVAVYHCPSDASDQALLIAYFGGARRNALARLKLMKIVVVLREALWYAVARRLSTTRRGFDLAAAAFFTRCRVALADPHLPAWVEVLTSDV